MSLGLPIPSIPSGEKPAHRLTFRADHFWSLFGRNVPDCSSFVEHSVSDAIHVMNWGVRMLTNVAQDGFTLHYDDPKNPANYTEQIVKIRQHLFKMQGKEVGQDMPSVPCPEQ